MARSKRTLLKERYYKVKNWHSQRKLTDKQKAKMRKWINERLSKKAAAPKTKTKTKTTTKAEAFNVRVRRKPISAAKRRKLGTTKAGLFREGPRGGWVRVKKRVEARRSDFGKKKYKLSGNHTTQKVTFTRKDGTKKTFTVKKPKAKYTSTAAMVRGMAKKRVSLGLIANAYKRRENLNNISLAEAKKRVQSFISGDESLRDHYHYGGGLESTELNWGKLKPVSQRRRPAARGPKRTKAQRIAAKKARRAKTKAHKRFRASPGGKRRPAAEYGSVRRMAYPSVQAARRAGCTAKTSPCWHMVLDTKTGKKVALKTLSLSRSDRYSTAGSSTI